MGRIGMEKDVGELLDAIVWAHRIVEVDDKTFVFRPLTLEERNMANYVYQQEERKVREKGIMDRKQLTKQSIANHLWKEAYEGDAKLLREKLASLLKERVEEIEKNKRRRTPAPIIKKLTRKIDAATLALRHIEELHTTHIELPSVEYQAESQRGIFFLHCSTLTFPGMDQVWPTFDDLLDEEQTRLVNKLMNLYYGATIAEESDIRMVARSGTWRSKWMGSKKNRGVKTLFDREMYDLTVDQFRLVYWSQVYDSAFESMDSPSDEVVDDDNLFDRWLDDQHQKRKTERKKTAFDKKVSHLTKEGQEVALSVHGFYSDDCTCGVKDEAKKRGNDKRGNIHNPKCPYGVFMYYNTDTMKGKIEDVQSANPQSIRKLLASEQKRLAESGDMMPEQQLRSNDKTRAALGMGTTYKGAGENKGKSGRARPR
jgi:hypothetical protein